MKEFIEKVTRPCRKTTDFFLLAAIISVVMIIVGEVISSVTFNI